MSFNRHDIHSITPRRVMAPKATNHYGRELSYKYLPEVPWVPAWHYRMIRLRHFQEQDWVIACCRNWGKEHLKVVKEYLIENLLIGPDSKGRPTTLAIPGPKGDVIRLVFRSACKEPWIHHPPSKSGFYICSSDLRYHPDPVIVRNELERLEATEK